MSPAALVAQAPVPAPLIRIRDLSLGFSTAVVLKEVCLVVPERGVTALMGPAGVGKSTLLRTLGRWAGHQPAFWVHGHIEIDDRDLLALPLDQAQREVALLAQKARLYTASVLDNAIAEVRGDAPLAAADKRRLARQVLEPLGLWQALEPRLNTPVTQLSIVRQRMLAMARLVSGGARCLLADEPLRDTEEDERESLANFLAQLARSIAVVMITHDQRLARRLSDHMCLFTAHRLVESGPTQAFFAAPQTELGRRFLISGNCWPSQPSEPPPPDRLPSWVPSVQETAHRPGGFHWVLPDCLGGMQCPGLLGDVSNDLCALAQLQVKHVVTLTEEPFSSELLRTVGIKGLHFPIVDMGVPERSDAMALCERISALLDAGQRVVLHCKAGLGRTGTMLACVLVFRGEGSVKAVHRVRSVNPLYIQSEAQLEFVADFEQCCRRQT